MIRGTTPTHSFILPFSVDMIDDCSIAYAQKGHLKLVKQFNDCVLQDNVISTTLNQDETLGFNPCTPYVEVQLKVKLKSTQEVLATDIFKKSLKDILDEEVME